MNFWIIVFNTPTVQNPWKICILFILYRLWISIMKHMLHLWHFIALHQQLVYLCNCNWNWSCCKKCAKKWQNYAKKSLYNSYYLCARVASSRRLWKRKRIDSNIRKQIKESIYHEVKLKKLIRSIPSTK